MKRASKTNVCARHEEAVSPVIATILMVAITVVLAGVLVVFVDDYQDPADPVPFVSMTTEPLSNPAEGPDPDTQTLNGGGWSAGIQKTGSRTYDLDRVVVRVKADGGAVTAVLELDEPDIVDTSGLAHYYAAEVGACSYKPTVGDVEVCAGATIVGSEFETMEGLSIVYVDNDASGTLSAGDTILVFQDNDADGIDDLDRGTLELLIGGQKAAEASLI